MQCGYINDGYKGHIPTDKSYIVISQLLGVIATRFYLQFRKPVLHQFDLQNRWDPLGLILWKDPLWKDRVWINFEHRIHNFHNFSGEKKT